MSGIILQVLSVIGIVLLILLGLILLLLLFLLFWPVTYRISGEKNPEKLRITGRADWLFGVLKVRYTYPEPNSVTVRLLWKTLMDTGQKKQEPEEKSQAGDEEPSGKEQEIRENQIVTEDSSVKVRKNRMPCSRLFRRRRNRHRQTRYRRIRDKYSSRIRNHSRRMRMQIRSVPVFLKKFKR